jgi:hypothetical protein
MEEFWSHFVFIYIARWKEREKEVLKKKKRVHNRGAKQRIKATNRKRKIHLLGHIH